MVLKKVEVERFVEFSELEERMRNVKLKGFPDVRIYEDAKISIKPFSPQDVISNLFTPQPSIYRKGFLDRVEEMAAIFTGQGIDIFRLNGGVDYVATDEKGEQTRWTLIPPVVEVIPVSFDGEGLDYTGFVGSSVRQKMEEQKHALNPELRKLNFKEYRVGTSNLPIICDGSHRIHAGVERGIEQNLLVVNSPKLGFPYYAAPKPYCEVHVIPERPEGGGGDKTHVLTEPGHKLLYRLFPSGGILSGTVRPGKS